MARRLLRGQPSDSTPWIALATAGAGFIAVSLPVGLGIRVGLAALVLIGFGAAGWGWLLNAGDREWLRARLRVMSGLGA
jgi:hypothetical protein